jgi:hypothetical protein
VLMRTLKLLLLLVGAVAAGVLWQQDRLAVLALSRVDPLPETKALVARQRYAEAADYLGFFMGYGYVARNPEAEHLYREIAQVRASPEYRIEKLGEGIFEGTSDEAIGQAAALITDFLVIGDIRDLTRQAINWGQDKQVDAVVAALSGIGLAASAAEIASAGGATPVKGGVSLLKAARRLGKLPNWLGRALVKGVRLVRRTGKLDTVSGLFDDLYKLARVRRGADLLAHTTGPKSLHRMALLTDTFGQQTAVLYRLGGWAFVKAGSTAGDLGAETIKLAATYGRAGLRTLDRVGAIKFVKYAARSSKVVRKGDAVHLLAALLALLPERLLVGLVTLSVLPWIPWRRLGRAFGHLLKGSTAHELFLAGRAPAPAMSTTPVAGSRGPTRLAAILPVRRLR